MMLQQNGADVVTLYCDGQHLVFTRIRPAALNEWNRSIYMTQLPFWCGYNTITLNGIGQNLLSALCLRQRDHNISPDSRIAHTYWISYKTKKQVLTVTIICVRGSHQCHLNLWRRDP